MRLTVFSDHALRTLVYLVRNPDRWVTIGEIAAAEEMAAAHLMKVTLALVRSGHVATLRGPHGGLRLARPPRCITVGAVVRSTEPAARLFPDPADTGPLASVVRRASEVFLRELDAVSLEALAAGSHSSVWMTPQ